MLHRAAWISGSILLLFLRPGNCLRSWIYYWKVLALCNKPLTEITAIFTSMKMVDCVCAVPGLSWFSVGSQQLCPTLKQGYWNNSRKRRRWAAALWSSAAKHLWWPSACLLLSGVERMPCKAEEPSCAGPRHVEEEVGSKNSGGRCPYHECYTVKEKLTTTKLFKISVNHLFISLHKSIPCLSLLPSPPPINSFQPLPTIGTS